LQPPTKKKKKKTKIEEIILGILVPKNKKYCPKMKFPSSFSDGNSIL
jgi:hypothetical protein